MAETKIGVSPAEEDAAETVTPEHTIDMRMQDTMRQVGAQIRRIRKQRGMTLTTLGDQTGTSVSMLSMLERGVATPSIGTLVAVSSALGTHMSTLFDAVAKEGSLVHSLEEQVEVETAEGVTRRLVHQDQTRGLEMVVNQYEPGSTSGSEATHHTGFEFGLIIAGELEIEVDGMTHVLRKGDAISYSSTRPHRFINSSDVPARTVWINLDS